jgi:hypothetical protein
MLDGSDQTGLNNLPDRTMIYTWYALALFGKIVELM